MGLIYAGEKQVPLVRGSRVLVWAGCFTCLDGPTKLVLGRQ